MAAVSRNTTFADVTADLHITGDCTTPEGAASIIASCKEQLGAAPSRLAHCVGSTLVAPLHRSNVDVSRDVLRVNLESSLWTMQSWLSALEGGAGSAVFVSSCVARIGVANHEVIAAAKGGIESMVRSAAATYSAQGVRVNAVAPGMTETPMTAGMLKMPAMRDAAARQYPLNGLQSADDVASALDWLLVDAARLTGACVCLLWFFFEQNIYFDSFVGRPSHLCRRRLHSNSSAR